MGSRPLLIAQLDAFNQSRGGDWYYRTFAPGRAMAKLPGVHVVDLDQAHRHLGVVAPGADVLVLNGVCDADLLPVIRQRKAAQRLTVFEINDDVEQMAPSNPMASFFADAGNQLLYRRLAMTCDAVQYSVGELERLYGFLNPRGRVFMNQLTDVPPLGAKAAAEPVVIGWGGSAGHLEDMAMVAPALCEFVAVHPQVVLHLMCSDRIWHLFDGLSKDRKRRTQPGSIEDYTRFVSGLDIGIAPNRDMGFNRARSDVKFLEYAAGGAVAVVQRLTPYENSVREGESGFFFGDSSELVGILERLVNNPEERRRVRVAAHQFVAEQRREGEHAAQRVEFYVSLMPGAASPKRERQIQNVVGEICSWEGAEVSGRHTVLSHTEFERKLYAGLSLSAQPARTEEAARLLREAALLDPSHALPDFLLGLLQQSEDDLATAVRKNPRSLRALVELGVMEARSGKSHKALERFLAAAELAPGYEGPFVQAAAAMADAGATKEAEEFAKLAESLVQPVRNARRQPAPGRPAWQMLDEDLHLQTLSPDYAPEGLLQMIPGEPRRVLDVGCFCGGTGRWLKRRYPKCRVSGVEMLEKAAAMAAEVYDRVLVGKLEDFDLPSEGIEAGSLDAIIAADVLEHVFNPWQALLRLRPLLAPGGALYVSLPNVRNLRVLSELAQGKFHYEGSGILDVTHVRFFTRASAIEMLEQTGFAVTDMRINPDQAVAPQFEGQDLSEIHTVEVDGLRLSGLGSDDVLELAALQFYIRATPAQAA